MAQAFGLGGGQQPGEFVCLTGRIVRAPQVDIFQRGTHRLLNPNNQVIATLSSTQVNLFALEGQTRTVCGINEGVIEGVISLRVTVVLGAPTPTPLPTPQPQPNILLPLLLLLLLQRGRFGGLGGPGGLGGLTGPGGLGGLTGPGGLGGLTGPGGLGALGTGLGAGLGAGLGKGGPTGTI